MMRIILAFFLASCGSGYYAAPSGHYLDGVPDGAKIISSSSTHRTYQNTDGCYITQIYQDGWQTTSIECKP